MGNPVNSACLRNNLEMLDDPAWRRGLPGAIADDVGDWLTQLPALLNRNALSEEDLQVYGKTFRQLRDAGAGWSSTPG